MEEMRNTYNVLVGKPEGKRLLGRPSCRCREVGWEVVDWIHLPQDRGQ